MPNTPHNGNSGRQWNVTDDVLARIDVPLVVYAVGFHAFDGQRYGFDGFRTSLARLVERADFFGLRSHGSIEQVRALLPAALRDKARQQPCPTTVARAPGGAVEGHSGQRRGHRVGAPDLPPARRRPAWADARTAVRAPRVPARTAVRAVRVRAAPAHAPPRIEHLTISLGYPGRFLNAEQRGQR
ncbi:hypothetical protein GCM10023082_36280 [Streptomyces tremellae]|uniref:Uncharacterized protein n=1 Tax=Streptomyces tremellae TaxID=1124239 RepID=A0ABP7FC28_9ACTN